MRALRASFFVVSAAACSSSSSPSGGPDGGRDATSTDALGHVDAAHHPEGGGKDVAVDSAPPPPPCGTTGWTTYGHDAQRTFASDGCTQGPLTRLWSYTPTAPTGRTFEQVFHAIADSDALYLQWMASDSPYTGTTAVDRVSLDGHRAWTWDSGTDSNFGNWLSRWNDLLVAADDGVYLLDATSGALDHTTGVDWWTQTAVDATALYVANVDQFDGPGLFVGALDDTAKTLWQQNLHQQCGQGWSDVLGGIALDGGVLFYAPSYASGTGATLGFPSGLFAFDAKTGAPSWSVTTLTPSSAISAASGNVYLIEEGTTLAARSEKDGTLVWSKPVTGPSVQAPVLAAGKAIVATGSGVLAFDAVTGKPAWSAPMVQAVEARLMATVTNGCAGTVSVGGAVNTSMAAALASNTLVVTAVDGIHLLSLSTGDDLWHDKPEGGFSALRDPVVVGHLVYVVDDGELVALKGK